MQLFDPDPDPTAWAAPPGPLVRVRMTVAYDGTGFRGFAANPGVRTVAGVLVAALERVLRHPVELSCAGRTDAGVHAEGQVVSFDARAEGLDLPAVARSVNAQCGPAVVVRDPQVAPPDFDARFSATARRYRYRILNREVADPFLAGTAWHVPTPMDVAALRLGCDPFIGEHDFSSFCRRPRPGPGAEPASLVRRVRSACWERDRCQPDVLELWIEADAFCQQMVRAIVGTLVAVGSGRRQAGEISGLLRGHDRAAAPPVAPPHGLCLWSVTYPEAQAGVGPVSPVVGTG